MRLFCLSFVLVASFLFNHVLAQIMTTDNLSPIHEALLSADERALVIFDVHDVLMIPTDQLLRKPYKNRLREALAKVAALRGMEEASSLECIVKSQHQVELVDPHMSEVMKTLKRRGIATIALTNAGTGVMEGGIVSENLMLARLKGLGIDFTNSFPSVDTLSFAGSGANDNEIGPIFKRGVIFTGLLSKGVMLQAFLQKVGFCPSQIIFVDDKLTNLASVETLCNEQGIPFLGFQYTGSEHHSKAPLNERRAELQLKMLMTEKRWVNDDEAGLMLNACP